MAFHTWLCHTLDTGLGGNLKCHLAALGSTRQDGKPCRSRRTAGGCQPAQVWQAGLESVQCRGGGLLYLRDYSSSLHKSGLEALQDPEEDSKSTKNYLACKQWQTSARRGILNLDTGSEAQRLRGWLSCVSVTQNAGGMLGALGLPSGAWYSAVGTHSPQIRVAQTAAALNSSSQGRQEGRRAVLSQWGDSPMGWGQRARGQTGLQAPPDTPSTASFLSPYWTTLYANMVFPQVL